MNLRKIKEIFNNYIKNFDLSISHIMDKYHHSYRVAAHAKIIARSENLSDDDINLAYTIGLYHDIARFEQWTQYGTYNDFKSFDHGDMGYKILEEKLIKDITNDIELQKIILLAVKNHNKLSIEGDLSERELLFSKIIKDADKIDIMIEQCNIINDKDIIIKDFLIKEILNNEICKNKDVITDTDHIIRMMSWVNDINFKKSLDILKENDVIKNKIKLLEQSGFNEQIEILKEYAYNKIGESDYVKR